MLAKVREFPTAAAGTVSKIVTVTYNPNAGPSEAPFTFTTSDGTGPYLLIPDDAEATITVTLKLQGNNGLPINWNQKPIQWISGPLDPPQPDPEGGPEFIFTLPAPTHYFLPWSFRFSIDVGEVTNILSPNFLVTLPSNGSRTANLTYKRSTGIFEMDAAFELASEMVLVNTQSSEDLTITFDLSPDSDGMFDPNDPIVWAGGTPPRWITPLPDAVGFKISTKAIPPPAGQSASFQFALQVPAGGSPVTVLSPDPIIINATIGDGG